MTTTTPPRAVSQRREALETANRRRAARGELKRSVKTAHPSVAALLVIETIADPGEDVEGMPVGELIGKIPRVGERKLTRLLLRARVSPRTTLGALSPRQREALESVLLGDE